MQKQKPTLREFLSTYTKLLSQPGMLLTLKNFPADLIICLSLMQGKEIRSMQFDKMTICIQFGSTRLICSTPEQQSHNQRETKPQILIEGDQFNSKFGSRNLDLEFTQIAQIERRFEFSQIVQLPDFRFIAQSEFGLNQQIFHKQKEERGFRKGMTPPEWLS